MKRNICTLCLINLFVLFFCTKIAASELRTIKRQDNPVLKERIDLQGNPPDLNDLRDIIEQKRMQLTKDEFLSMAAQVLLMQRIQEGNKRKEIIRRIMESKQKSVNSFLCKYRVSEQSSIQANGGEDRKTYFYASDGNKRLFQTESLGDEFSKTIVTYNNEHVKIALFPKDHESTPAGRITDLSSGPWFSHDVMPLVLASLVDINTLGLENREKDEENNLLYFLSQPGNCLYQKPRIINGVECVAVANLERCVYFDPLNNYCVAKIENYVTHYDQDNRLKNFSRSYDRIFSDFQDYGNGITLPHIIRETFYDEKGTTTFKRTISVDEIQINPSLSPDLFEDIFPDDTLVHNAELNISYIEGDSPSINALLKETAKSKRIFIYRYISVGLGLAMIFGALLLKYREYLKRKSEQNAAEYTKSKEEK